jgi:hypothetical protein
MQPIAAVLGAVAGLFGAFMLYIGVRGIIALVAGFRRFDAEDVFGDAMFNIIGVVDAFFAVRWIRSAIEGQSRDW